MVCEAIQGEHLASDLGQSSLSPNGLLYDPGLALYDPITRSRRTMITARPLPPHRPYLQVRATHPPTALRRAPSGMRGYQQRTPSRRSERQHHSSTSRAMVYGLGNYVRMVARCVNSARELSASCYFAVSIMGRVLIIFGLTAAVTFRLFS